MFESLRRAIARVVVFLLLSILILSFAVWGIGDMVRTGGQGAIATVGGKEISTREFTTALQNRRQAIQRQFGQVITPEQSRALGIDSSVLGELVNGAAVSNHAEQLGIRLSDQTIAEIIRTDRAFQGPDNTFNRTLFDERIRQAGFTEESYFTERREEERRTQLTGSLASAVVVSDAMVALTHRFREETRRIAWIKLGSGQAPKVADPDEAALKAFYEESKRSFVIPERRKIAVLVLTPEALAERARAPDEEVRQTWEQGRAEWDQPERRRLQQIVFRTKEEAEGEAKALREGKSFLMAALEANAHAPIDQGLVARREIGDATLAEAAFGLPLNKVSEPVAVRGGFVVMRVSEIQPARKRPFEEVRDEVRQAIEDGRRRELANKLHDEIEDRRGAATGSEVLKRIAGEMNLKLIEAPTVDARGNTPEGQPAIDHPDAARFIQSAFDGGKELPREALQLSTGGEAWVEVIDVLPETVRPFDEVKAEVETMWRTRETERALAKEARTVADRIKAGESLETVARGLGVTIATTKPFKRGEPPEGLSTSAARIAFTLPKGGAGTAALEGEPSRAVFVVTDIAVPEAPSPEAVTAVKAELARQLTRDSIETYIAALRERQSVSLNEAVYRRAVGLDQAQ